jgi:hypothetical protein
VPSRRSQRVQPSSPISLSPPSSAVPTVLRRSHRIASSSPSSPSPSHPSTPLSSPCRAPPGPTYASLRFPSPTPSTAVLSSAASALLGFAFLRSPLLPPLLPCLALPSCPPRCSRCLHPPSLCPPPFSLPRRYALPYQAPPRPVADPHRQPPPSALPGSATPPWSVQGTARFACPTVLPRATFAPARPLCLTVLGVALPGIFGFVSGLPLSRCLSRHTSFYPRSAFVPLPLPAYFVLSPARPRPAAPPRLLLVLPLTWASPCPGLRSPGRVRRRWRGPARGRAKLSVGREGQRKTLGYTEWLWGPVKSNDNVTERGGTERCSFAVNLASPR